MAQQLETAKQSRAATIDGGERMRDRPVFVPLTDIYETKDAIIVLAEMPGVAPDGIDITLERQVLTIRGRGGEQERAGYRQVYAEYSDGDYERSFTLSAAIDRDRIEASQKAGVLRLTLPKAEAAKPRKITLKTV